MQGSGSWGTRRNKATAEEKRANGREGSRGAGSQDSQVPGVEKIPLQSNVPGTGLLGNGFSENECALEILPRGHTQGDRNL